MTGNPQPQREVVVPAVMYSTPWGEKLHLSKECATLADSKKFKTHEVCHGLPSVQKGRTLEVFFPVGSEQGGV